MLKKRNKLALYISKKINSKRKRKIKAKEYIGIII